MERVLKENAGSVKLDSVNKGIKNRVKEIVRRRNSSYAVVVPVVSVAGGRVAQNDDWIEKEFF